MLVLLFALVLLLFFFWVLRPNFVHEQIASSSFNAGEKRYRTVAVVGGSMAGYMAAKTISSFAENVVLLEQKQFRENESAAPQTAHLHVLLKRGLNILNKMFPELVKELRDGGAQAMDWIRHMKWHALGRYTAMSDTYSETHESLLMTRVFLDTTIRRNLAKVPNIRVIDDATVTELKLDAANVRHVVGLKYKNTYDEETSLDCDLVIDCTGGSGSLSALLKKQAGIDIPVTKIKTYLSYSTVIIERKDKANKSPFIGKTEKGKDYMCQYYSNFPPNIKAMAMLMTEVPFQYILSTVACNKAKNVTSFEGLKEYAKGTAFEKEISKIMEEYDPVTPVKTFNKEGSVFRYFDRVSLQGYIALGDSVCSYNPVYGQGMASASQHCLILDTMLRSGTFAEKDFQIRVAQACTIPWMIGSLPDMSYPATETENVPLGSKLLVKPAVWLMRSFMKRCATDVEACKAFNYLLHMQQDHAYLFLNPVIVCKILHAALF